MFACCCVVDYMFLCVVYLPFTCLHVGLLFMCCFLVVVYVFLTCCYILYMLLCVVVLLFICCYVFKCCYAVMCCCHVVYMLLSCC